MLIARTYNSKFEIDVINDFCHDALLERENIAFYPNLCKLILEIKREVLHPKVPSRLFGLWRTHATLRSKVIVHYVKDCNIKINDVEDMIVSVEYNDAEKLLTFHFVKDSKITANLIQFHVELIDEELVDSN